MGDFTIFGLPVSLGTMIYQAAIFTILVLLLKRFVFKKLVNIMESRKEYIANQLQLSEKYKLEAENALEEQYQLLKESRKEAIGILKHSEQEAKLIVKDAKDEAKKIIKEAKDEASYIRSQAFMQRSKNKGA
jgi:F-type H+-transporting ATPase subunit b